MAYYSYKSLCYRIPEHIEAKFKEDSGREPDGDPNYDGDYWTLADMYVDELIQQRDDLLVALKKLSIRGFFEESSCADADTNACMAEMRAAIARFEGGAA